MRHFMAWFSLIVLVIGAMAQDNTTAVQTVLEQYAQAVREKNLAAIEAVVDTSNHFTVFEGGHVNNGWKEYRDTHLAPELKMFRAVDYRFSNIEVTADNRLAVATLNYSIAVELKDRKIAASGVGTFVLVQTESGWKIRHIHTTRKPQKH